MRSFNRHLYFVVLGTVKLWFWQFDWVFTSLKGKIEGFQQELWWGNTNKTRQIKKAEKMEFKKVFFFFFSSLSQVTGFK